MSLVDTAKHEMHSVLQSSEEYSLHFKHRLHSVEIIEERLQFIEFQNGFL